MIKLLYYNKQYRKDIGGKWYKVSYYGIIYYTNKKPYFSNSFSKIIEKQRY